MSELSPQRQLLEMTDERRGSSVIIRVAGEIDLATAPRLEQYLTEVLSTAPPPHPVVVDLTDVAFLGSCGLALLLRAHEAAAERGTPLRIVAVQRAIRRPVEAVGLRQTLVLHPTVESALEHTG